MDVWPLRPNWRGPYRVSYSFLTEIMTSRSGKEQRRALRQTPRKSVEFLVTCADERWRVLTRTFAKYQGPLLLMAEVTSAVRTTSAVPDGGSSVPVTAIPQWLYIGAKVVLVDGDRMRERTVDGIAGLTVTFEEASVNGWPAGVRLCAGLQGRLPPELSAQQYLPRVGESTVTFDVSPGSELPRDPGDPPTVWDGREVFLGKPNWGPPRDVSFSHDVQVVDYGVGRTRTFQPVNFGTTVRTADYLAETPAQAEAFLAFFERQMGRLGEFFVPTDNADIQLAAPTTNAFLFIDGTDFEAIYATDPVAKALCFRLSDGSRFYRKVTAITVQGGQSRIQLDLAVPQTITGETEVISWMPLVRNATDELTIEWLTDGVARARFTYQSLPYYTAE